MRFNSHVAVLALALGGCASVPPGTPLGLLGAEPAAQFNTGRLTLLVTDFAGQPLSRARVDVEGTGDEMYAYRTAAFSDFTGRVSFAGVPQQVRITVYHAESQANYSREFIVPTSGNTELQMLLETAGR